MDPDTDTQEGSGARVQVVVRVRPVLPAESVNDAAVTCSPDGTKVQVLLPEKTGNGKELLPGTNRSGARSYEFDACLPGATTQTELFDACGLHELVDSALDGYSVTVFAFGQTGSGKTHTMIGPRLSRAGALASLGPAGSGGALVEGEDGVLPRALAAAYAGIEQRSDVADFTVSASCLELYNEAVTDLLATDKSKQLAVRKDERGNFRVDGLSQVGCKTAGTALRAMAKALAHRHTRAHALNDYSSRSHCLMTFVFASKEKVQEGGGQQQGATGGLRRYGKLVLVDLAGSERLRETGNTAREAVRETGAINKSLFTLGQVLASLAQRSGAQRSDGSFGAAPVHVPFRDSKLTQLLWDGLRGSGRALMLACLSPMKPHAEESLNTLHFAGMALRIKATPIVLLDPQDQLVLDLRNTIRQLQEENRALAVAMSQLSQGVDAGAVFDALPEKLRVVAARDTLASAPGPARDSPHQEQKHVYPPPLGGSGHHVHALPHPQTAPDPSRAASPSGASGAPWTSAGEASVPTTPAYPSPDMLQVTPSGPSSASYAASLLPPPINYSYSFSSAPRTGGPGGTGGKKAGAGSVRPGPASMSASYASGVGGGRRSVSVDTSARRLKAGAGGAAPSPATMYGSPATFMRANSGTMLTDAARSGPSVRAPPGAARAPAAALIPVPLPDVGAFPELAAMEAQFQAALGIPPTASEAVAAGGLGAGGVGPGTKASAPLARRDEGHQRDQDDSAGTSRGGSAGTGAARSGPAPEPKALNWAEHNMWFGQDAEMTAYAYEVHDELVTRQGYDAASDAYYDAIDAHVSARFPDKWRTWHARPPGGVASPMRRAPPAAAPPAQHFGAGLKVSLKDATPAGMGGGGLGSPAAPSGGPFSPVRGLSNVNANTRSKGSKAAGASPKPPPPPSGALLPSPKISQMQPSSPAARSGLYSGGSGASVLSSAPSPMPGSMGSLDSQQQPGGHFQQQGDGGAGQSPPPRRAGPVAVRSSVDVSGASGLAAGSGAAAARRASNIGSSSSSPGASTPISINPFGLSSGYSTPLQHRGKGASGAAPASPSSGWTLSTYNSPGAGRSMLSRIDPPAAVAVTDEGWRAMQVEYVRQRQAVLAELRQAKEDAEEERRKILLKIGRTLGASRWQR